MVVGSVRWMMCMATLSSLSSPQRIALYASCEASPGSPADAACEMVPWAVRLQVKLLAQRGTRH